MVGPDHWGSPGLVLVMVRLFSDESIKNPFMFMLSLTLIKKSRCWQYSDSRSIVLNHLNH